MKKIVLVNKFLMMGGIEKSIELLCKNLKGKFELEVVYLTNQNLDDMIVNKIERYAKVSNIAKYYEDFLTCDVCIWCSLYFDYSNIKKHIKADKYYAWIHSMPRVEPECLLDDKSFVNEVNQFICVSEAVKNNLNIDKESIVINNFVDDDISMLANDFNPFSDKTGLKLVTVGRLSKDKGFDRVKILVDTLIKNNIDFTWFVVGNGRTMEDKIKSWFADIPNVIFVGKQSNPYPYIKNSDYLVLLSNDESWGIVITEALVLHTPVIVTNFESSKEQVQNLKQGIIIDRELKDYDIYINNILNYKEKLKNNLKDYTFSNPVDSWLKLLNDNV